MSNTVTFNLNDLLSARPAATRKPNEMDTLRSERIEEYANNASQYPLGLNISEGEKYVKGNHKDEQMRPEHVCNTYRRKFGDRLDSLDLDVYVIGWKLDENGNGVPLDENDHYAIVGAKQ